MKNVFSKNLQYGFFEVYLDKPEFPFEEIIQIHSSKICSPGNLPCEGDGIIEIWENFSKPFLIKTADCLPIVIEGKNGVSLIHAGWRGLNLGILKCEILKTIEPEFAFIGPSIQPCCFEVSQDFQNHFPFSHHFFKRDERYYFDLSKEATQQLVETYSIKVSNSDICTCCDLNYNSYRRDKTTKRNFNIYRKGN